jgi:hypothetical protein
MAQNTLSLGVFVVYPPFQHTSSITLGELGLSLASLLLRNHSSAVESTVGNVPMLEFYFYGKDSNHIIAGQNLLN